MRQPGHHCMAMDEQTKQEPVCIAREDDGWYLFHTVCGEWVYTKITHCPYCGEKLPVWDAA